MSIFNLLLTIHISFGLLAVSVGLAPILTRKGGRAHRLTGRAFVVFMAILLVCAWAMTFLHFSVYFLALSASASLAVFSGVRVLGRKRPDLNPGDRAKPIDRISTFLMIGVVAWIVWLQAHGAGGPPAVVAAIAVSALTVSLWDLMRFTWPTGWPFSPRLWMYEHLAKMLGAYSAALSAFAGNFLTFLPQPWSQLWPTVLFQVLTIGWIIALATRRSPVPA